MNSRLRITGIGIIATTLLVAVLGTYWPYVEYAAFKNYIVENLCVNRDIPDSGCQGKCHLKKQLTRQNNRDKQHQETPAIPQKDKKAIDFFIFTQIKTVKTGFQESFEYELVDFYSFLFDQRIFHPPRI